MELIECLQFTQLIYKASSGLALPMYKHDLDNDIAYLGSQVFH